MTINIRPLRTTDIDLLKEFLYQAIFVPEGTAAPDRSIVDLPELEVYYDGFGADLHDHAWVAEVDEQVVGMAWVRMIDSYGYVNDQTPVLSISLLPAYRGRGYGTKLLEALFLDLKQRGYQDVSLSVQRENPAYRLYQGLGFEQLEDKGTEVVMLKKL